MSVYLVRHGQTDWNKAYVIQGRVDIPLNEEGIRQAKELAAKMKEENIHIDLIFVSPLIRARQTADILNEVLHAPILVDERIIEEYYGTFEGVSRKNEDYLKQHDNFVKRYPNGESYLDVCYRVYSFLNDIKKNYRDKNVLMVCHGGMSRLVRSFFEDEMENRDFLDNLVSNCDLKKYEFKDRHIPLSQPARELK